MREPCEPSLHLLHPDVFRIGQLFGKPDEGNPLVESQQENVEVEGFEEFRQLCPVERFFRGKPALRRIRGKNP